MNVAVPVLPSRERVKRTSGKIFSFRFKNPNILDKNTAKEGEITGMYLIVRKVFLKHVMLMHVLLTENLKQLNQFI